MPIGVIRQADFVSSDIQPFAQGAGQPSESIVDRATNILDSESQLSRRRDTVGTQFESTPEAVFGDLQKRITGVRDQLQDLVDTFARVGEQLAAFAPLSASNPLATVAASPPDPQALPVLRSAQALPGVVARVALGLVNDSPEPVSIVLHVTNLVSESGAAIPAELVTFAPNPLNLPGHGELPVQGNVQIPPDTRPGKYVGLVQASGLQATRALMTVDVKAHPTST